MKTCALVLAVALWGCLTTAFIDFGNIAKPLLISDNQQCHPNQVYDCENFCPATCQDPARAPCKKKLCFKKECQCAPGFIRYRTGFPCVRPDQCTCSLTCPANSSPDCCANPVQPTCENPAVNTTQVKTCIPGCVCNPGFLLLDGQCIQASTCQTALNARCAALEANSYYEPTCAGGFCRVTCPLQVCPIACSPGCTCNPGFLFINGDCVAATTCP